MSSPDEKPSAPGGRTAAVAVGAALACLLTSACAVPTEGVGDRPSRVHVENYGLDEPPQYGGTLRVGTYYVSLSALSWDPADWSWKLNHDTGSAVEQLFVADLDKSLRKGGPYGFRADAWIPPDALRGELAESWEWESPLTVAVRLRRGVVFPEKPGVMESRELTADDVVFSYQLRDDSPRKIATYFDHIERVYARDRYTVVFQFESYNAEWAYRFGYGYYSSIVPTEVADTDRRDWRNVVGTGPLQLTKYIEGHSQVFSRNADYWDTETLGGREYPLPFIDRLEYRIIKDEATWLTALRTGKIDILETVRWLAVEHLQETTPELQWARWLGFQGTFIALRVDRPPLDDRRVRRALNMGLDKQEILELFYGGHGELFAFPQHPDYVGYYQPLEEMPESVQELYVYDPDRARQLLAEAGVPDGFRMKVQVCACNASHMDLLPLIVDQLGRIGVEVEIEPLEYAAFLSVMSTRSHAEGYLMNSGHVNPITTLRKNFVTGQLWNPSMYSDPEFDAGVEELIAERDEAKRRELGRHLTAQIVDEAPYIFLPTAYIHTAWWPWVKNYNAEIRAGAVRPGPIYARVWIDQDLKRELGFE